MGHRDALVPGRPHVRGDVDAPVTVVMFGDFECPYCQDAAPLVDDLVASSHGKVRLVWRHFPLFEVHPHALAAALASEAAADQGRFWEMHDALLAHGADLSAAGLVAAAREAGVGEECVVGDTAQRFRGPVEEDYAEGLAHGVEGTPVLFLNGHRYRGRVTADGLRAAVESLKLSKPLEPR
ncbi:DsbA family protein [Luteimicrobium subarcticum]|nr:DsbA family protein [Luteimicrobium subarcticum]